jgi:hypothetical protein
MPALCPTFAAGCSDACRYFCVRLLCLLVPNVIVKIVLMFIFISQLTRYLEFCHPHLTTKQRIIAK